MEPSAAAPLTQQVSAQPTEQLQRAPMHLPVGVVSTGDVRRLRREVSEMEETLQAVRLRTHAPLAKLPRLSRALEELAATNRLNFLMPDDRKHAAIFLDNVLKSAPVLHISFASEASRKFTTEIVMWLRANFDSEMLVEIGLEPNIAAGCVVRTTNRYFDFSLQKHLEEKRSMLMEKIMETVS